jgi:hypothetical protein
MYPISLPNFEKLKTFNLVCSVKKLWELANSLACYTEIKYFTNCREMSLYFLFIVHGNEIQEKNQYRTVSCKLNGKLLFKNKNLFFFYLDVHLIVANIHECNHLFLKKLPLPLLCNGISQSTLNRIANIPWKWNHLLFKSRQKSAFYRKHAGKNGRPTFLKTQ